MQDLCSTLYLDKSNSCGLRLDILYTVTVNVVSKFLHYILNLCQNDLKTMLAVTKRAMVFGLWLE